MNMGLIGLGRNILKINTVIIGAATYQTETIQHMNAAGIAADSTVYFTGTPQEKTGLELWDILDNRILNLKSILGVTELKTKLGFWYSRVGGNNGGARHNTANPAKYTGTLYGGVTIDETGISFNGTNGYMDTGASMTSLKADIPTMDRLLSAYGFISKTNVSGTYCDFGSLDNTGGNDAHVLVYGRTGAGNFTARCIEVGVNYAAAVASGAGAFMIVRNSASEFKMYYNNALLATIASSCTVALGLDTFTEGALNADAVIVQFAPKKHTQFWAGALTYAEALLVEAEFIGLDNDLNR